MTEGLLRQVVEERGNGFVLHRIGHVGWLVLPEALVPMVERLAQNLCICPSTLAQRAALACFEPASIAEYELRRAEFRRRRDRVVPALEQLGLRVPVMA